MYAVIETGGKQYKVTTEEKKDRFDVELLEAQIGDKLTFDAMLFADGDNVLIGKEASKVKVVCEVVSNGLGKKLRIFTYKAKKNVRKHKGHRQPFTTLRVVAINQ